MRGTFHLSYFLPILLFGYHYDVTGQNAGINTTDPDPSAALHVMETDSMGLLIPSPESKPGDVTGLIIYNPSTGYLEYSNGSAWISITPIPSGTIIMWSGLASDIPDGWVLCNGASYNVDGTTGGSIQSPNLKGRFVVGYSSGSGDYGAVGNSDGEKREGLTVSQLPSHTHSITSLHNHAISASGDHTHDFSVTDLSRSEGGFISLAEPYQGVTYGLQTVTKNTNAVETGINVAGSGTGISIGHTGSGELHENRPLFYTLAFIMKL